MLLDHEDEIGGRFSVFTNVGLLPAIWAGGNVEKIRAGAARSWPVLQVRQKIMRRFWGRHAIGAYGGGAQYFSDDGLCRPAGALAFWYRQLWAESLGKEGKGSVPVNALGPVDQHSQMQLYMAGPDDKFYTLLSHQTRGRHRRARPFCR